MSAVEEYREHAETWRDEPMENGWVQKIIDTLDLADAALDHALSWEGLLEFVDQAYPAAIFTGASGDPGPRFIVLLRELKQAEAALAEIRAHFDAPRPYTFGYLQYQAIKDILARHDAAVKP